MDIRHKGLNAGEAHAFASFQFFDRIARSSAAHQLGLQLRLMGLITRAALGTPIFHKIGKGALAGKSINHTRSESGCRAASPASARRTPRQSDEPTSKSIGWVRVLSIRVVYGG